VDNLKKNNIDTKETTAQKGLKLFNNIFSVERKLNDLSPEERYTNRLDLVKPKVEALKSWLESEDAKVSGKSYFKTAIRYSLNCWKNLTAFLEDGRLDLTNNKAERNVKDFVIGRKNYLFSSSSEGAAATGVTFSIVETAKANNLDVFGYIKYLLEELSQSRHTSEKLEELMPWSDKIPEEIRIKNPIMQK